MALHFVDSGHGFPVVFLHAFPLNGAMWAKNAAAVRDAGFRTIVPDLPGFGTSVGSMKGIPESAGMVVDLLGELGVTRAVFCGLSMGGYLTFELLRTIPVHFAGAVFSDTNADADTIEKRADRNRIIEEINSHGTNTVMEALAKGLISPVTQESRRQVAERITNEFKTADKRAVCCALNSMANRSDSNDLLSQINFPVKLIFGADDPMLSSANKMKAAIRNSTLDVIQDAGHFPNLETPLEFNRILIGFLKEHFN